LKAIKDATKQAKDTEKKLTRELVITNKPTKKASRKKLVSTTKTTKTTTLIVPIRQKFLFQGLVLENLRVGFWWSRLSK
jgi:uncharacterized protein YccT (UPF0319 family)